MRSLLRGAACFLVVSAYAQVPNPYKIAYASNLTHGDAVVDLTNAGTQSGNDPEGRMCVNVYTFDPAEEMVSCCACLVTPNSLMSLSVNQDLVHNALTPGTVDAVVIKLLSTVSNGDLCNAAGPFQTNPVTPTNPGDLADGLLAWVDSLHLNTRVKFYQKTERAFQNAGLSSSELDKLTSTCGFIQASGSGYGICGPCNLGGTGSGGSGGIPGL